MSHGVSRFQTNQPDFSERIVLIIGFIPVFHVFVVFFFFVFFFFRQAGARDLLLTMLNRKDSMKFDGNSLRDRGSEGCFFFSFNSYKVNMAQYFDI